MSLSFSGLERLEEGIEGFFAPKKDDGGNKPIFRVEGTVTIASAPDAPTPIKKPQPRLPTLHTKKRSPLDGFFAKRDDNTNEAGPSRPKPRPDAKPTVVDLVADDDEDEEEKDVPGQWKCPQCGAIFTADRGSADQAGSVEAQKQEHEDYHFARSLQDGPSPKRAKTGKEDTQGTKGKVKKKEGLKAFFAPRPATKR